MLSFRFQKHLSLVLALCFLTAGLFAGCSKGEKESSVDSSSAEVSASQSTENSGSFLLAHGFDWGPSVDKIVISDAQYGPFSDLSPASFSVAEEKADNISSSSKPRKVEKVYYSDASGNAVADVNAFNGELFLTIELQVGPEEGALLYFHNSKYANQWFDSYSLSVSLSNGKSVSLAQDAIQFPEIKDVEISSFTGPEGHAMSYAFYSPSNASESSRPLVIWLHGGGEGGTDPRITSYGNKVVSLFGEDFQSRMGGAFVLVPQCPGAWIERGDSYDSIYLQDLKALIDDVVSSHNVDKNRILIGGCSNGGFMTLDLLLAYPDYFAKAFPICEIFDMEELPDEKLQSIKDIPMWFVYAKNDQTVDPELYEEPLLDKLKSIGASDLHVSVFDDVHDITGKYTKDGAPYQYLGHFSWIYFFNDACTDGDSSLWQWLAQS